MNELKDVADINIDGVVNYNEFQHIPNRGQPRGRGDRGRGGVPQPWGAQKRPIQMVKVTPVSSGPSTGNEVVHSEFYQLMPQTQRRYLRFQLDDAPYYRNHERFIQDNMEPEQENYQISSDTIENPNQNMTREQSKNPKVTRSYESTLVGKKMTEKNMNFGSESVNSSIAMVLVCMLAVVFFVVAISKMIAKRFRFNNFLSGYYSKAEQEDGAEVTQKRDSNSRYLSD